MSGAQRIRTRKTVRLLRERGARDGRASAPASCAVLPFPLTVAGSGGQAECSLALLRGAMGSAVPEAMACRVPAAFSLRMDRSAPPAAYPMRCRLSALENAAYPSRDGGTRLYVAGQSARSRLLRPSRARSRPAGETFPVPRWTHAAVSALAAYSWRIRRSGSDSLREPLSARQSGLGEEMHAAGRGQFTRRFARGRTRVRRKDGGMMQNRSYATGSKSLGTTAGQGRTQGAVAQSCT